jgi:dTDP-6-deoxy-L-talose 4-dehydrogenase (NAD+)
LKIAVTGATGFIGRHVVNELRTRGLEPTLLVRRPGEFDLHEPPVDLFERIGRPQTLIHLAWGGLPNYHSVHHFESEFPAQYRFLRGLVMSGLDSCVVAGTCLEYGMQTGELVEDACCAPTTAYGLAKDALRRELQALRAVHPFGLTWARLFYTYGEGQAPTSLYALLCAAAQRGDATFDMSDGKQLRDFLPVQEVARSIVQLAVSTRDAGVVNICSGKPTSVRDQVERWMDDHGWHFDLNCGRYPYPDYETPAFWGSRRKLDSLIARGA